MPPLTAPELELWERRFSRSLEEFFVAIASSQAAKIAGRAENDLTIPNTAETDQKEKRWCCARCSRPLLLSAAPLSRFQSQHCHMRKLANVDAENASVSVLVFSVDQLNPNCVLRKPQIEWEEADSQAYFDLECACRACAFGVQVHASNVAENIGQIWTLEERFLKI